MENTAPWKDVQIVVLVMDNVDLTAMVLGSVVAKVAGMEKIAACF